MPSASSASSPICSSTTLTSVSLYSLDNLATNSDDKVGLPHESIEIPLPPEKDEAANAMLLDVDEVVHAGGAGLSKLGLGGLMKYLVVGILSPLTIFLGHAAYKCGREELAEVAEKVPELNEKLENFETERREVLEQKEDVREKIRAMQAMQALQTINKMPPTELYKLCQLAQPIQLHELAQFVQLVQRYQPTTISPPREPRILAFPHQQSSTRVPLPSSESPLAQECIPEPTQEVIAERQESLPPVTAQVIPLPQRQSPSSASDSEQLPLITELMKKEKLLLNQELFLDEKIDSTLSELKVAGLDKAIGYAAAISGATISVKAAMEWIVQLQSIISSDTPVETLIDTTPVEPELTPLGNVVEKATKVFTPIAAVCAVVLGAAFARKSEFLQNERQAGKKNFEKLLEEDFIKQLGKNLEEDFIKKLDKENEDTIVKNYLSALTQEIKAGERFDNYFLFCNNAFLASSIVYTFGVIAETVLLSLYMAGVIATAINPVVATAVVASCVVMLVFSHQFLLGHGQQKQNDSYRTKDAPGLDRDRLALVDRELSTEDGVRLRARYFRSYQIRDNAQQKFLSRFLPFKESLKLPRGSKLTFETGLSEDLVLNSLENPADNQALIKYMKKTLTGQQAYLQHKIAVYQKMDHASGESPLSEKDSALSKQIVSLIAAIDSLPSPSNATSSELSQSLASKKLVEIKKAFMLCQNNEIIKAKINWSDTPTLVEPAGIEEKQDINKLLVQYLLDTSHQASLAKLVETEFQAGRLRNAQEKSATQSSTKPGISRALAQNASVYEPPQRKMTPLQDLFLTA